MNSGVHTTDLDELLDLDPEQRAELALSDGAIFECVVARYFSEHRGETVYTGTVRWLPASFGHGIGVCRNALEVTAEVMRLTGLQAPLVWRGTDKWD